MQCIHISYILYITRICMRHVYVCVFRTNCVRNSTRLSIDYSMRAQYGIIHLCKIHSNFQHIYSEEYDRPLAECVSFTSIQHSYFSTCTLLLLSLTLSAFRSLFFSATQRASDNKMYVCLYHHTFYIYVLFIYKIP